MFFWLISCNNKPLPAAIDHSLKFREERACYQYHSEKDIVLLTLILKNDSVTGTLSYNLYEKDNNYGTLRGQLKEGLLVADYLFQSEGVLSNRQVVFKLTGTSFTEGYGEVVYGNGKATFKNIDSLNFGHSFVLDKVTCK
jgi:hypothetical protein